MTTAGSLSVKSQGLALGARAPLMIKHSGNVQAEPVTAQVQESGQAEESGRSSGSASRHEAAGDDAENGISPGTTAGKEGGGAANRGQHGGIGPGREHPLKGKGVQAAAGTPGHVDPCMKDLPPHIWLLVSGKLPAHEASWFCDLSEVMNTVVTGFLLRHVSICDCSCRQTQSKQAVTEC